MVCVWCNVTLGGWQCDDCPWFEHVTYSPLCKYVRKHVVPQQKNDSLDSNQKSLNHGQQKIASIDSNQQSVKRE